MLSAPGSSGHRCQVDFSLESLSEVRVSVQWGWPQFCRESDRDLSPNKNSCDDAECYEGTPKSRGGQIEFCTLLSPGRPRRATAESSPHSTRVMSGREGPHLAGPDSSSAEGDVLAITRVKVRTLSANEGVSPPSREAHRVAPVLSGRDGPSSALTSPR